MCCKSWKTKFSNFLEVFWNNNNFLSLINQKSPLTTTIANTTAEFDGFAFVVGNLANNIFEKVFFGIAQIDAIPFVKYKSNENYVETVYLITRTG